MSYLFYPVWVGARCRPVAAARLSTSHRLMCFSADVPPSTQSLFHLLHLVRCRRDQFDDQYLVTRPPLGLPFGKILPNTSGEDEFFTNSSQILLGKPFRLICCDSKHNIIFLPSVNLVRGRCGCFVGRRLVARSLCTPRLFGEGCHFLSCTSQIFVKRKNYVE